MTFLKYSRLSGIEKSSCNCLQEADMDEEGDAERAAQWDLAAADAAYKAQVEAALAQQRAVEEEQRLLMEQLEVSRPCLNWASAAE
jgi:hypothetical protein